MIVYKQVCLGACVSMNKHVCVYKQVCMCIYEQACVCVQTSMCECEHVCLCVCVYVFWGQGLWQRVQPETGRGGSWALLLASDDISGHQEPVL